MHGEYRLLRSEITTSHKETRAEIERIRDGHRSELSSIYKLISSLDLKVTERNAERRTEHRIGAAIILLRRRNRNDRWQRTAFRHPA